MKILFAAFVSVLICSASTCLAASAPDYTSVKSIHFPSGWTATAYQAPRPKNDYDTGDTPAKLCFSNRSHRHDSCTKITSSSTNSILLNYQTVKKLEVVQIAADTKALLFQAEFWGGGSGYAEQVSLWLFNPTSQYWDSALVISTNEMGQYKLLSSGALAGTVITADPIWAFDEGESHFSAHRYEISVYRFKAQDYAKMLTYRTKQKYNDEEDEKTSDVIAGELTNIRSILGAVSKIH